MLITGASAIGKSELRARTHPRGNGFVADDIVELYRISPDTLEGRCPAVLKDFLEVRGIGVLNIRTIFGETAVRLAQAVLKLMVHLEDHGNEQFSELDRLQVSATYQEILGVPIRKVTIPVALVVIAVLVEAAVRNFVLNQRDRQHQRIH